MSGILTEANLGRVDQGVDFTGAGAIPALGDGIVTRVAAHGQSGWPGGGLVVYKLTSTRGSGRYVYVAENIDPSVKVGDTIKRGQTIATARGAYPFIETGWANVRGQPVAPLDRSNPGAATSAGQSFLSFLRGTGQLKKKDSGGGVVGVVGDVLKNVPGVALGPGAALPDPAGLVATGAKDTAKAVVGFVWDQVGADAAKIMLTVVLVVGGAVVFGLGVRRSVGGQEATSGA